jgi:hypothetical protein
MFEGAPPALSGGEHNLTFYALFQEYLKLYEVRPIDYFNSFVTLCLFRHFFCVCLGYFRNLFKEREYSPR